MVALTAVTLGIACRPTNPTHARIGMSKAGVWWNCGWPDEQEAGAWWYFTVGRSKDRPYVHVTFDEQGHANRAFANGWTVPNN